MLERATVEAICMAQVMASLPSGVVRIADRLIEVQ
jgi:hypothetical protein